jgi:hypothetical protein
MKRINQQRSGSQLLSRPSAQTTEIAQVSHTPTLSTAQGIKLGRPSPNPQILGQEADSRADDQTYVTVAIQISERVVAQGQIARKGRPDLQRATIFESDFGGSFQALALAATHDEQRRVLFRFLLAHCFKEYGVGLLGRLAPVSERVFVALYDPERVGMRGCASHW